MKCKICEEKIDGGNYFSTIKGEQVCENCWVEAQERASKVIKFSPDGIEEIYFDEDFNFSEPGEELPTPIKKQKWVFVNAWRGYTDWELDRGFIKYTDGWITGIPDETTKRKAELGEYFQQLLDKEIVPPVPIYWIFGATSNVFSQTSTIVVREKDEEAIRTWIEEINGTSDEFQERFK